MVDSLEQDENNKVEKEKCTKNIESPKKLKKSPLLNTKPLIAKLRVEFIDIVSIVRRNVHDWCEQTSSHGFSNIARTNSLIVKLIWISMIVFFTVYCFISML